MNRGFENYAQDQAVKTLASKQQAVLGNRHKVWSRAYRSILSAIQPQHRVLDFGCGAGQFLEFLSFRVKTAALGGYEISPSQMQLAKTQTYASPVHLVSDLSELKSSYDWVFCHHVIEHIPDQELAGFVKQMASKMAPRAKLVISTPNGLNPFAYSYFMSTDRTHLRMHSSFTLAELLRSEGLKITQVSRESPQAYDLLSAGKFLAWWLMSFGMRLGLYVVAAGSRGAAFPLVTASTFYVVAEKE